MNMQARQVRLQRRTLLAALAVGAAGRRAAAQAPAPEDPWPSLAAQIFAGRPLQDGGGILGIDAPYRAEDAALVPLGLHCLLPADDQRHIRSITLVIDGNPSPLAAVFSPGPAGGMCSLSTRVRIDYYTNVHAAAELTRRSALRDERRLGKAAGGCSAPAAKLEADPIPLGTMRSRCNSPLPRIPHSGGARRNCRYGILNEHRHADGPGHPALCPRAFRQQGADLAGSIDLLLAIESGISISENPTFRFDYRPNGRRQLPRGNGRQRGQVVQTGMAGGTCLKRGSARR